MAIRRDPVTLAAVRDGFVEAIRLGHGDGSAADLMGVDRSTIFRWKAQGKQDIEAGVESECATFVTACARANGERITMHLANVQAAAQTDAQNSRWLLAAWDKQTFGTASKVQLTGADDGPVKIDHGPDLSRLTKAELQALDTLLLKAAGEATDP